VINQFNALVSSSEGGEGLPDAVLVELIKSENALASWYACKAIGSRRIEAGIDGLLSVLETDAPLLDDHETDRRLIAAWSLAKFGFDKVGAKLIGAYDSGNELLRLGVVDTLGELRDERGLKTVIFAIQNDDYKVALWAALSAAKIGRVALQPLKELLTLNPSSDRKILIQDAIEKIEGAKQSTA